MKNFRNMAIFLVIICFVTIIGMYGIYKYKIGPTGKDKTDIEFIVEKGMTFSTIAESLEEKDLIHSETFYKFYLKINDVGKLEQGKYYLNKSMGVEGIIKELSKGSAYNPDVVKVTIPEGKHLEEVAEYVSDVTNNSKEDILNIWNSEDFIDEVINKYWFITDEVKDSRIRYALEGYLFPSTYELLNKDVDAKYVAYKMLDQMNNVLSEYKTDIENSGYSVHEILTMASIVEHEAILDEDRPVIAGVFYNRIDQGIKLGSCATVGYAIGEWKLTYSNSDLKTDSPYNTYYYAGLPIGPGNMPSKKSIEAAINPTDTDYLFFIADVCSQNPKTYFSKTNAEHEALIDKYLGCIYG